MKRSGLIVLSLVIAITLILSACNGNNNANNDDTPSKPTENVADTTNNNDSESSNDGNQENTADSVNGTFEPPITLTTVRKELPTIKYAEGDSVDNNPWTRAYKDRYGIEVKTMWTVDATQWEQKTNLMIASGDLPDFFLASPLQFKQLLEADLIEDMTAAYDLAPDRVKQVLTEGGDLPLKSATIDGRLMAIPWTGVPKEGSPMIWVRMDWLKKLNLPEPKTMDDVFAISKAFTEMDPDENGEKDTFGLALDKDFALLNGFLNGFHAYNDIWLKDSSGNLTYSTIQPEMKAALAKLQEMSRNGQIDPEFGTKAFPKVAESIVAGKIGLFYSSPYSGLYPLQSGVDQDPSMEWKAFPIVSIDSEPAKNQTNLGIYGYWVVKKGVKHPEALFSMIDFWIEVFYENRDPDIHNEYVNNKDSNVEVWQMNSIAVYKAFKNVNQRLKVLHAMETNDLGELTGDDRSVFDRINQFLNGDRSMWAWNVIFGKEGSMAVADYYRENELYIEDQFITSPLPEMVEKSPTLNKMKNELFTNIILGKASIDEFDNFVEEWKRLGGDEITQAVNDWYKNQ